MALTAWLAFLACAFLAEVIGTMAGFGAATILTPVAALFMDIKSAIVLVTCFHLFGTGSRVVLFRRSIDRRILLAFGSLGVLCSLLGAFVAARLPSEVIRLALGLFLIGYVGAETVLATRVRLPLTRTTLIVGGILYGLIAGLIGTGGAIRSACLLVFDLPKERYLGTSAAIAFAVDLTRLPVYLGGRMMWHPQGEGPTLLAVGFLSFLPVAFAGAWIGRRLIQRVGAGAFRRFVLVLLLLMGLKLLVDGWHGLA